MEQKQENSTIDNIKEKIENYINYSNYDKITNPFLVKYINTNKKDKSRARNGCNFN